MGRSPKINCLSFFAGAAGLDLSVSIAIPDSRVIGMVEIEGPTCAILGARMEDGSLDQAPVWSDIRTFPVELYRGKVDLVYGGAPCTDLSLAGPGLGILEGSRSSLFFDMLRRVVECGSPLVFFENVEAIVSKGEKGIAPAAAALAEAGFDAEWISLRASDVGAPHRRARWFCLAWRRDLVTTRPDADTSPVADSGVLPREVSASGRADGASGETLAGTGRGSGMAYASDDNGRRGERGEEAGVGSLGVGWRGPSVEGDGVDDPQRPRLQGHAGDGIDRDQPRRIAPGEIGSTGASGLPLFPPGPAALEAWRDLLVVYPELAPAVAEAGGRGRNWRASDQRREQGRGTLAPGSSEAVADATSRGERERLGLEAEAGSGGEPGSEGHGQDMADAVLAGRAERRPESGRGSTAGKGESSADAGSDRWPRRTERDVDEAFGFKASLGHNPDGRNPTDRSRNEEDCGATEPELRRALDGVAHRVDRLRACGNGVVAIQGAIALRILLSRAWIVFSAPDSGS